MKVKVVTKSGREHYSENEMIIVSNRLNLKLDGITPSKKNGMRILTNRKTGRPFVKSSSKHGDWHDTASYSINSQIANYRSQITFPIECCSIKMSFSYPDKIRRDTINSAESILDLLVDLKVIKDDNWKVVRELTLIGSHGTAGAEIEIFIKHYKD